MRKDPEQERDRESGEGKSEAIQWQKDDAAAERSRRDLETDVQGTADGDSPRSTDEDRGT